jgi:N-acetylglucosamine malate deacetylase 2
VGREINDMKGMLHRGKRLVREYVFYRPVRGRRAKRERKGISASELITAPPGPALIIAAHPDDEVIGAGALLSRLHCADVLHITDGAPRKGDFTHKAGFAGWSEYAAERQREAAAALALLGRDTVRVQCLAIPDQEATSNIARLARRLAELLTDYSFVVTHAYEGGHPDHDATTLSVHAACCLIKECGIDPPSLLEMTGYHGWGGQTVRGVFIPHPDAGSVAALMLTRAECDLKRRMFACHATQRTMLTHFSLEVESFRSAPRYDFLAPPHRGVLLYERHCWGITGQTWRCAAKQALAELGLLDRI